MADFEAVLRKTLGGMTDPTPEMRAKVYDKARATINRQIEAMAQRPSDAAIQRQFDKLEESIAALEEEFAPPPPPPAEEPAAAYDADSDLDHLIEAGVIPAELEPSAAEQAPAYEEPVEEPVAHEEAETVSEPEPEPAFEPEPVPEPEPASDEIEPAMPEEPAAQEPEGPVEEEDPLAAFLAEQERTGSDEDDFAPEARGETRGRMMDAPEPVPVSRSRLPWIVAAVAVLLIAGAGVYAGRDAITGLFGSPDSQTADGGVPVREVPSTTITADGTADAGGTEEPPADDEEIAPVDAPEKFTQRLLPDGREVDEGPAQSPETGGEGTSVAEQTGGADAQPGGETAGGETDTADAAAGTDEETTLPVGQRAIFYQERTGSQAGTAEAGAAIWSVVQESPGGDLPPEPAIRAEASIPELGLTMEMTIRRNADDTFPASHVIELLFRVPDTFEGRGIADVQRITFKGTEQDPGNALIGVAAALDTNIFLIALTDAQTAIDTNLNLMRREEWIDIPMQYISGRRALITLEKGIPGEQVFNEVLSAWEEAGEPAAENN
jgi:hypothetical protein